VSEKATLDIAELADAWSLLDAEDRAEGFRMLDANEAEDFFFDLDAHDQADLLGTLPLTERRRWIRLLPPDDAVDLVQAAADPFRHSLIDLLDEHKRKEVSALLAYAEDAAGGLMSSRYARVRPDMTVDEAIAYLRRQAVATIEPETIYYVYVLDSAQRLLGVISFRDLFASPGNRPVREVMVTDVIVAHEDMDQEEVAQLFAEHDLLAMPVVDDERVLKGIVTVDDIVDVVEEEATEDIQKLGGMEALDEPYMRIGFVSLMRKRGGWLVLLFLAQLLTASVIAGYEAQLDLVTALALFIPLILSSGGNSGSQAATLVIRALTVGEVRLRDWWRVARREIAAGLTLGAVLGVLGFGRIIVATLLGVDYDADGMLLAWVVSASLIGVVVWGTLVGSMVPFALDRLGLDPASASGPLVATLSDVMGLLIYFSIARVIFF
jgi:magnesium transporter